jgi:hypothetical protein
LNLLGGSNRFEARLEKERDPDKSLTRRAGLLEFVRESEQLAIYRKICRLVLLYLAGGSVFVAALITPTTATKHRSAAAPPAVFLSRSAPPGQRAKPL